MPASRRAMTSGERMGGAEGRHLSEITTDCEAVLGPGISLLTSERRLTHGLSSAASNTIVMHGVGAASCGHTRMPPADLARVRTTVWRTDSGHGAAPGDERGPLIEQVDVSGAVTIET
jgi:hypothetical protein